jgi:hypothetical protein
VAAAAERVVVLDVLVNKDEALAAEALNHSSNNAAAWGDRSLVRALPLLVDVSPAPAT